MANALPLILVGGAALLFLSGNKKQKKPSGPALPEQCIEIKSLSHYIRLMPEGDKPSDFPQAIVSYPNGERARAHELCRAAAAAGFSRVFMLKSSIMVDAVMEELEAYRDEAAATGADVSEFPMPSREDIAKEVIGVSSAMEMDGESTDVMWGDIPWDDVRSLFE